VYMGLKYILGSPIIVCPAGWFERGLFFPGIPLHGPLYFDLGAKPKPQRCWCVQQCSLGHRANLR